MKKIFSSFLLIAVLCFAQNLFAAQTDEAIYDTHITIAHTNDVHGHIEENPKNKEFGYAKIATLVKQWKKENPNLLLIDAGDTFQGSIFADLFKGESLVPLLNKLPYEVMVSGNHEFDYGAKQTIKLASKLDFPMISANVFWHDGRPFLTQTHFTNVAGERIAFLGLVSGDTPILTHPDNVKDLIFKSPIEVAKELVPQLKTQAEHVIIVSHIGLEVDRELARQVNGIDLIIGGHSHTPVRVPERINNTYIVQDWEYGKSLGRVELYYHNGSVVDFEGGLVEYDPAVPPDPEMQRLVKKISGKVNKRFSQVIAKAELPLDGAREIVRTRESNIGNWICDTMLLVAKTVPGEEPKICLMNGGGIRTQIPAGPILLKQVYELLPFPNNLVLTDITGQELWQALEHGVGMVEKAEGRFPQVGGLRFQYNPKALIGKRLQEVWVGAEKLDLAKTYRLVSTDFLLAGGDGYQLPKRNYRSSGIFLSTLVSQAMKAQKRLSPGLEGRISVSP